MKVFVYYKAKDKNGSYKKIAVLESVVSVVEKQPEHIIEFALVGGETLSFDTYKFKTTTYQN